MRPRAPESVTKGADPTLPQLLGPSWPALGALPGRPGRAPGRPKRSPERQNARQWRFLTYFFTSFFHVAFCIRFWSPKFGNDLYRTLENKRFASTGALFSQNRFFRLATKIYRKITSKTLRFESQNRKKT